MINLCKLEQAINRGWLQVGMTLVMGERVLIIGLQQEDVAQCQMSGCQVGLNGERLLIGFFAAFEVLFAS